LLENKYLPEFYTNKININKIFENKKTTSNNNYFAAAKNDLKQKKKIMVQTNAIFLEYDKNYSFSFKTICF
jgi:hypothetical protein